MKSSSGNWVQIFPFFIYQSKPFIKHTRIILSLYFYIFFFGSEEIRVKGKYSKLKEQFNIYDVYQTITLSFLLEAKKFDSQVRKNNFD